MIKVAKKIICIIMVAIIMIMPNVSKATSELETFANSSKLAGIQNEMKKLDDDINTLVNADPKDIKQKNEATLKAIDTLLKTRRDKYPLQWTKASEIYKIAEKISEEIHTRQKAGKFDKNYKTVLDKVDQTQDLTLEQFVKSSEFGKVTSMPKDELDEDKHNNLISQISSTLTTADGKFRSNKSNPKEGAKEAKEYLEGEYLTYMQNWSGESVKKTRSYIGYMFGSAWKTYKAVIEDADSGKEKTPVEKFDEIYEEFKNLPGEKKKDTKIVSDYEKRLRSQYNQLTKEEKKENNREDKMNEVYELSIDTDTPIYNEVIGDGEDGPGPSTGLIGGTKPSASHTLDEIINEAKSFLQQATETTINGNNLKEGSSTLYNILLSLGIVFAVIIGIYLGVKFMISTAEDKAKVKEALIPYIVGCVIVFSSFIIWKLAITLLSEIG